MKVERREPEKPFQPVVITLESVTELQAITRLCGYSIAISDLVERGSSEKEVQRFLITLREKLTNVTRIEIEEDI